jgi:serine/threonine protein kinase
MPDTLSDDERTVVTARTDQFRHALIKGGVTDWEPFLEGLTGPGRRSLLTELVAVELNYRWGRGERPTVEEYLTRFPELGPAESVPPELVLEEHQCRLRAGELASGAEYRDRFPALFPALQTAIDSMNASRTVVQEAPPRWEPSAAGVVAVEQQYELVRELGRGMFGEVWLARKKPSGIEKAVKILLQPADRDAAQRELKSLELIKNLRHPYLLATEDFWISNNRLHVVMELADGTLRGRLKHYQNQGQQGIPLDELFRYIAEAAEGLDFLHGQKITHRDVKPDNILILRGHAKVADFGLARAQEQLVESMSLAGTPAYMAPEVWGGEGGPASDQYSLAYAYTELRQGKAPLRPRPFTEMLKALQNSDFEFTAVIGETERAVLLRAMAPQSQHRYPTCTDFVAELAVAVGIPFAGGTGRVSAPPVNPSLSAIFGGGTERNDSALKTANETIAPTGTIVEDEKLKEEPPSRARVLAGTLAVIAVPVAIILGVWLLPDGGKPPPTTQPDPTVRWVYPMVTQPEEGTSEVVLLGRNAPQWVFVKKDGVTIRFRLIAPQSGPSVGPFYISETKITNKLYSGGEDAPVMNVTALAAREWAQKTFGGDIPSADEWDHAVGFFDQQGQATPTLPPGRAWIDKPAPGSVKRPAAEADVTRYGLLDVAGNGREWTRTVITRNGERRDLSAAPLAGTDKLILRGRNYTLDRPLSYAILGEERTQPHAATPTVGSPYTGFRVVLPLP